jgi:hypothetical protein
MLQRQDEGILLLGIVAESTAIRKLLAGENKVLLINGEEGG